MLLPPKIRYILSFNTLLSVLNIAVLSSTLVVGTYENRSYAYNNLDKPAPHSVMIYPKK